MLSRKHLVYALTVFFFAVLLVAIGFALYGGSGRVSFDHGIASGDPLADRVVVWTRVTPLTSQKRAKVRVEVASDEKFESLVYSSVQTATAKRDYTVKIDVKGLSAGTVYYYRFRSGKVTSAIGRTKTLPQGDVNSVKLAVFSCSNYPISHGGYFNVYGHAAKTADVDAVIHLGDYIYEYGRAPDSGTGNSKEADRDLPQYSDKEILTLDDYRRRYALYRTDPQLQALHAAHPFITVWDDHEIANDAYVGGAQNHDESEGSFDKRKTVALQAYYEWMPVRSVDGKNPQRIYRSFSFGNLVELFMLDTRLSGREKQLGYKNYFDPETGFDGQRFRKDIGSPERTLLGPDQLAWLRGKLAGSTATWQVLGQQVLMGRMNVPFEIIPHLGDRTPEVAGLIDQLTKIKARMLREDSSVTQDEMNRINTVLPYNLDAWDGYPAEREAVLGTAYGADNNLVVLAGDTHNGWANNLKDAMGNQVGVEFATPSVSSGGLETYLKLTSQQAEEFARDLEVLVDDLVYSNTKDRGYIIVSFTAKRAQSQWIYVDTVKQLEFRELTSGGKMLGVLPGAGNRKLIAVDD
ncbi:MAG: alkaline phosphatase [Candidatus Dadabacteria bacterium]|nr:alkaline phosphatase [Candidatus Dadabacteria bacterium]MYA48959.1 alkaline phosphatase [Candidatus Dadabacteria bacterium]MYG83497.1 alkaline phosphatase [Candidatus Dadabacteria bacterium]MYK48774.1 alkaline phosphatase [Candidatus Dadabacteria bacterium]